MLFFSENMSLKIWDEVGLLEREVALYNKLSEKDMKVSFITFGDETDPHYTANASGIEILCNRWRRWKFPWRLYSVLIPLLHAKALRDAHIIKTNQMSGSNIALKAAKLWNKPLVVRCGWMKSLWEIRQHGKYSDQAQYFLKLEKEMFEKADALILTTPSMRDDVVRRMPTLKQKIRVIPNYVDTSLFKPMNDMKKQYDVVFVGRLTPEKNVEALLKAISSNNHNALLIGKGYLRDSLITLADKIKARVIWKERVPNFDLPKYINKAKLFVFPSLYENHPKALIEAMSCGMPVVGADSPGINEIIEHGVNGWLCGTESESIGASIQELLDNPGLCESLGKNARQFAIENFSLDQIFEMEYRLYKEVLNERLSRVLS
mgnify:CR=1 FL=1